MLEAAMLEAAKLAMQIKTTAYDNEINNLIEAALLDLGIAGVETVRTDPLIKRAVITYCRMNFGSPADYDRLHAAYCEQKAQLQMATGYTDWGDSNGES